jgi:hypothetical protein
VKVETPSHSLVVENIVVADIIVTVLDAGVNDAELEAIKIKFGLGSISPFPKFNPLSPTAKPGRDNRHSKSTRIVLLKVFIIFPQFKFRNY